jgi:hypothetical protein
MTERRGCRRRSHNTLKRLGFSKGGSPPANWANGRSKDCHACKAKQKQVVGGTSRGFLCNKHDQGGLKAGNFFLIPWFARILPTDDIEQHWPSAGEAGPT